MLRLEIEFLLLDGATSTSFLVFTLAAIFGSSSVLSSCLSVFIFFAALAGSGIVSSGMRVVVTCRGRDGRSGCVALRFGYRGGRRHGEGGREYAAAVWGGCGWTKEG